MESRAIVVAGGISLIVGALAFVFVFSYLAANFDYPRILDGRAAEVFPKLLTGGEQMRAVWAVYAFLPLLLVPGAIGVFFACPLSSGRTSLGVVAISIGTLAMCLGLMRWPSINWILAQAYEQSGVEAQASLSAVFDGLNSYLGNYIGEFLGEICLSIFFLMAGLAMLDEPHFPSWVGWCGLLFSLLFAVGALRNFCSSVQPISDINNYLLPLWLIVLGASLIWYTRRA